jgi:hypothetical protein
MVLAGAGATAVAVAAAGTSRGRAGAWMRVDATLGGAAWAGGVARGPELAGLAMFGFTSHGAVLTRAEADCAPFRRVLRSGFGDLFLSRSPRSVGARPGLLS